MKINTTKRRVFKVAPLALAFTLLSGCGTDLASLIEPSVQSVSVASPLAEATGGDTMKQVTGASYVGTAPSANALQTQQIDPDNIDEDAVKAFVDGITESIEVEPCNWTFADTAKFATHCGMLAQNAVVSDFSTNVSNQFELKQSIQRLETDVTVGTNFTVTFDERITNPPDRLQLGLVSLAASIRDENTDPPAKVFITSLTDEILEKRAVVAPYTWTYTLASELNQSLTNSLEWVTFPGPSDAIEVFTTQPTTNRVDLAVLITLYAENILGQDAPYPSEITAVDFSVQLGDTMTFRTNE